MSISKTEIQAIKERSEHTSKTLKSTEPVLFDWAVRKKLDRKVLQAARPYHEHLDKLDEIEGLHVEDMLLSFSVMTRICSDSKNVWSVLKSARDELKKEEINFLKHAVEYSWYITAFEVVAVEGPGILRILDYDDDEEYLLYSEGVREMYESGIRVFYSLLFDNGECLQTYGGIFYLKWADRSDFEYLARRISPHRYAAGGLSDVLTHSPVLLVALWSFAEFPPAGHRRERAVFCTSVIETGAFDAASLPGNPEVEEYGEYRRVILDKNDIMFGPRILWDGKKKRCFLRAGTEDLYRRGLKMAAPVCKFPEEPDFRCSLNMETAAYVLIGPDEFSEIDSLFDEIEDEAASPVEVEDRERLEKIFEAAMNAHNRGAEIDPNILAEETGADIDFVLDALDGIGDLLGKTGGDSPKADFAGLSPDRMHRIRYGNSDDIPDIVALRPDRAGESDLAGPLYVMLARDMLGRIRETGGVKLTPKGNLPLKIVRPIHELSLEWKRRNGKTVHEWEGSEHIGTEDYTMRVSWIHALLELMGYITVSHNRARLSEEAAEILEAGDIRKLYTRMLSTAADRFNLRYYTRMKEIPILQASIPFQLYLMRRFEGDKLTALSMAEKLLTAFPMITEELEDGGVYFSREELLAMQVDTMIFDRFAVPFGLVTASPDPDYPKEEWGRIPDQYHLTGLFDDFFEWKVEKGIAGPGSS